MTKTLYLAALAALLAGCSSPPEPRPVEWDQPAEQINNNFPQWTENNLVIPAAVVSGHWSYYIANFSPENIYSTEVWYAVAHSSEVTVSAWNGENYFIARDWLRKHGYKGLVTFRKKTNCLTCTSTEIFFYH
ncbi:TPA: cag pathogenicity island Cag12 family protein [Salmonella enterica subsp. enterica serovar Java]|uniref:Cag pathogenicity island protein Cag12 n=1 Tax=Salmonella diarizonae TaxID=59204 RepID=A0A6C8Y4E1_SALDZ|nr:hypothetical protein [Salmonella enterica subsp. diarizonae]ECK6787734.1 hypothetical protein [Salmonella enterica]EHO7201527.1 hypothetical protein [Salmonella enterica]MIE72706.1 hypothetical protein [Salmonella enterica subsp. diarizonae]